MVIQSLGQNFAGDRAFSRRARTRLPLSLALNRVPVFLTAVVLMAFVIRMLVVLVVMRSAAVTGVAYNTFSWEMGLVARSIALGQGFSSPFDPVTGPTALVPPVYPYLIAGAYKLFGLNSLTAAFAILTFNSLCSALTCIPLYFLTRNSLNHSVARLAALGWAIYPFSVYFSAGRVWDYALTSLLFICCLWAAQRLHTRGTLAWAAFGLLYGVAALSNPSIASLLPFLLLLALYKARWTGSGWRKAAVAALVFFAVCTPWNLRNQRVMHASFFLRDGFWLEFYAGNNGDTSESNTASVHPPNNPAEMRQYIALGETAYMQQKRQLALAFVHAHPLVFAETCARRVLRFWTGYWSLRPDYLKREPLDIPNVPFCLFLLYFMLRGIARWWREDREAALLYLLAIIIFPLPYFFTHSSPDYRQPIEPLILILVTVGLFGTAPQLAFAHGGLKPAKADADVDLKPETAFG